MPHLMLTLLSRFRLLHRRLAPQSFLTHRNITISILYSRINLLDHHHSTLAHRSIILVLYILGLICLDCRHSSLAHRSIIITLCLSLV